MLKKTAGYFLKPRYKSFETVRTITKSTTVDDCEIEYFNKNSSKWWDPDGPRKVLHRMNFLRVPFVKDSLINASATKKEYHNTSVPLKGLKLADIGCGGGILSESLAKLGCEVTGIDVCAELVSLAQHHASQDKSLSNLKYEIITVEEFASKKGETFDVVVASEVVEHVNNQADFISECVKCVKPGGSVIITTINKTVFSRFIGIFLFEYVLGIIPKGTHQYEKFIKPETVTKILQDNDCHTKTVKGMKLDLFTSKFSWTTNCSIFYVLHAVKSSSGTKQDYNNK